MKSNLFYCVFKRQSILFALLCLFTSGSVNILAQAQTGWIPTTSQIPQDEAQMVYLKDETTSGLLINCDIPGVYVYEVVENDTTYQRISLPGQGTNTKIGKPELPVVGRVIEIPYDVDLEIDIYKSSYETFKDFNVYPFQPPERGFQPEDSIGFIKDHKAYKTDSFYPENLAEITMEDIGIVRGHRIAFLKVKPVQYNPVKKELRLYSNIEVVVSYSRPAQIQKIDNRLISTAFEDLLKSTIINYKDINRFDKYVYEKDHKYKKAYLAKRGYSLAGYDAAEAIGIDETTTADEAEDEEGTITGCEYLIITTSIFYDDTDPNNAVLRFRNWKRQKGLITEVVLLSDIPDSDNSTVIDEDDIIDYIQTAYDTWYPAPTYVLFIGDAGDNAGNVIIPTNYRTQDPSHGYSLRGTDIYYTTVDGNDYFPDIFSGRLAVDTDAEATVIIDKIINHEQNPPGAADANYYMNASVIALFEYGNMNGIEEKPWIGTCEEVRSFLMGQGYNVDRIYTRSNVPVAPAKFENGDDLPNDLLPPVFQWNGTANDITNAINAGRFSILYRDHGERGGWSHPWFSNADVDNLNNGNLVPIIFSYACQTGWFDNETDKDVPATANADESFCEHLIRNPNGGTAAVIGSIRNSKTGWNDFMALGAHKAIWNNFNPNPPYKTSRPDIPDVTGNPLIEMGQILTFSKIYMANAYTNSDEREEAFEIYHLFGDPNMNFLPQMPVNLKVIQPEGIGGNYGQDFVVKVYDQADNPQNLAIVSLCNSGGDLVSAKLTDAGGIARFTGSFTPGDLTLTVTADGFIPHIETVAVSSGGGLLNRLNPDNGTQGQPFNVGGRYFTGNENVKIYIDDQLMDTKPATGGEFGQSGVQDISITIPNSLQNGKYNIILEGENSGKFAVDVFHVRDPNPLDLFLYSQWDNTTYYLHDGHNPTWNNPDIQLYNTADESVGSNNLTVGNQYRIEAVIRNKSNFPANNATVTFKWANFGSAQRTWTIIGTDQVNVPANSTTIAEVQWTPPITGHLCVVVEIYHGEDIYTQNNSGQENCDVGPTSSPYSVKFGIRNPDSVARAIHFEVRQLYDLPVSNKNILWETIFTHPDPQVIQPDTETEVEVTVDPDYAYIEPGSEAEFAVTCFLDDEILGGINVQVNRSLDPYQLSIHAGYVKPLADMDNYFSPGACLILDAGYRLNPNISIISLIGMNFFTDVTASTNKNDQYLVNLNLDVQYRRLLVYPLSSYIRAGGGYYLSFGNWSHPGINAGLGIIYHLSNSFGIDIGADYHMIPDGLDFDAVQPADLNKDLNFLQIHGGININF